jgi:hypothetical protein
MAALSSAHRDFNSPQFRRVALRLKAWRKSRRPGQRIPESLWRASAKLAAVHGVSRMSTALKLSYYDLQRHVARTAAPVEGDAARPQFIEVTVPEPRNQDGTLEVINPSGRRLVWRVADGTSKDVIGVIEAFLRQRE